MSIMNRNKRLRYFNQGGANDYTTDITYGTPAATVGTPNTAGYQTAQRAGPDFTGDTTYADTVNTAAAYNADPANRQVYYPDSTVAGFDEAQQQAQESLYNAAGRSDTINNDLEAAYREDLDPNSGYNQRATQQAAQQAGNAFFGAGTPGSARGQYASSLASREALDNNRYRALQGLAGVQGNLTHGADIINRVGANRQLQTQREIDEDVKRYNYNQLAPQQQIDQQLALRANEEAIKAGNAPVQTQRNQGFGGFFRDTLLPTLGKALVGSWFNEGGPVPQMQGRGIVGQTQGGMSPQGYAQDQMPMQGMSQQGMPIPQPTPAPGPQPTETMDKGIMEMDEMSEIDMMEDRMNAMAIQSGGDIVVTRKETRRKTK